ncbi:MAG TPA: hypothetical protein VF120_09980 [Ktedonobacterales bacterium]
MTKLANRVHMFARPEVKDALTEFFTSLLGCTLAYSSDAPGNPAPVLAFTFPGGGSLSVEFTADALDDEHARRGLWIEVEANDAARVQERVLAAGYPQIRYSGNDFFYVAAPGGQVLRIVSSA